MKILGFAIIRWKRLQEIHARIRELKLEVEVRDRQLLDLAERMGADVAYWKSKVSTANGPADPGAETKGEFTICLNTILS